MRTPTLHAATAALLLLSFGAAACTDTATAGDPRPDAAADPTSTDPTPVAPIAVDWSGPTLEPITFPNGWMLARCQGAAPLLCVTDRGEVVGAIESGRWSLDAPVADPEAFLREQLDDFLTTFASDRAATCGPDYAFELDGRATVTTVDGHPALTYATRGVAVNGDVHERALTTTVVADGEVVWISAVASAPDGCVDADLMTEFTPADLITFAPWYDAVIRGSSLGGATLPDGEHQARLRFEGDVVVLDTVRVLSGEEARLAAVAAGVIAEGEDLPNDVFVDEGDAATWTTSFAPGATAAVYDCAAGCQLVDVDPADVIAGEVAAFNGEAAVYELTLVDGRVTALSEVYLP